MSLGLGRVQTTNAQTTFGLLKLWGRIPNWHELGRAGSDYDGEGRGRQHM